MGLSIAQDVSLTGTSNQYTRWKFNFNGTNQYATHASWDTLGNSAVYAPAVTYVTDNDDGFIVSSSLPITEFGRVGANYHSGSLYNVTYIDTSPLNGKPAVAGPMTTQDIDLQNAEITFDVAYTTGAQTILGGTPAILTTNGSDVLVHGANVDSVTVDGITDPGTAISGHMRIVVRVSTGIFNQLGETSAFGGTFTIENDAY